MIELEVEPGLDSECGDAMADGRWSQVGMAAEAPFKAEECKASGLDMLGIVSDN